MISFSQLSLEKNIRLAVLKTETWVSATNLSQLGIEETVRRGCWTPILNFEDCQWDRHNNKTQECTVHLNRWTKIIMVEFPNQNKIWYKEI